MIKSEKIPKYIVFLSYLKDFVGTEKRVWIIHGNQAIRVQAIEVILYCAHSFARNWQQFLNMRKGMG